MPLRFYVVDKVTVNVPPIGASLWPEYIVDLPAGTKWAAMDYGGEATMLVGADVSTAQHTALAAHADVMAIPLNLESTVGSGNLATVRSNVESLKMPGNLITAGMTYRQVVKVVGDCCLIGERFDKVNAKSFFEAGITLGTQVNELTTGQRNALKAAAEFFGVNTSTFTGTMTLRQALWAWSAAMPSFTLAGEAF